MGLLNDMKSFKTSLLDIDNVINNEQPMFNVAIINLIKSNKTDLVCWLNWKVNNGFYKYNTFSRQLESTLYDFDPKQWFIYQILGSQTLFICKRYLNDNERRAVRAVPVRLYGSCDVISLERVLGLINE